ncbi:MAG: AraC family transcriptional regulator [Clostridia bacterium]|nr:AraC family transcriptional regulator [Clostridia bacterium]
MDWIIGLQNAIDYIEDNLTDDIDYEKVAEQSFSSSYHFQRVFSILFGYTVGEYVRNRRLSQAGAELAARDIKVIDVALKYGYESPDSFSKAFQRFHGILPSQARQNGKKLKSFSRLVLKFSLEGGSTMNYRIEEKDELILTGYKRRFTGTPSDKRAQENDFYISTRANQYMLHGLSRDCDTQYNVMCNFDEEGYDFYIASELDKWHTENLVLALGEEDAKRFETLTVPKGLYVVCETARAQYPTLLQNDLRKKIITEWLPSSGYQLANAPEISVAHWYYEYGNKELSKSRYIELWLPITKA